MRNHPKLVIVSFLAGTAFLIWVLLSFAAPDPETVPPTSETVPPSDGPPFDPEIVPPPREVPGIGEQAHREEPEPPGSSPDGTWKVVRVPEGGVSIRNRETGAAAAELVQDADVIWSPDPARLAVITPDGGLRLLDLLADRDIAIRAHDGRINSLEFDSRGERVVTAGEDGSVSVWNATTGENLLAVFVGSSPEAYWGTGEDQIEFKKVYRTGRFYKFGRIDVTNGRMVDEGPREPRSRAQRMYRPKPEDGNSPRAEPGTSSWRYGFRRRSSSPRPAERPKKGK